MDPPSNSEQPFTGSYHSDILLLSAWLNGSQPTSESLAMPGPKENDSLRFLSHISTVLTIGNDSDKRAQNVLAVSGHVDASAVHCLVFTENTAPSSNPQKEAINGQVSARRAADRLRAARNSATQLSHNLNAGRDRNHQRAQRRAHTAHVKMLNAQAEADAEAKRASSMWQTVGEAYSAAQSASVSCTGVDQYCRTNLVVDDNRGMELLLSWDQEPNHFPFNRHLQDTFDVLSYVRRLEMADPKREDMMKRWQKFVHRRAYRKLAFRVMMFATHWGKSPFDIIGENLSTIRADPKLATTVELALPELFHGLLKNIKVLMTLPLKPGEKVPRRRYVLDSASLKYWLKLLRYLWSKLCAILFQPRGSANEHPRIRSTAPDADETTQLVQHIHDLHCLHSPLEQAEINEMNRRNLERETTLFDPFNYTQPFAFAASPGSDMDIEVADVAPAPADTQENDMSDDDETEDEDNVDDDVDHEPVPQTQEQPDDVDADEFTPERNENQRDRLMRSIDTMWAWNQAATYLFHEGRLNFSAGKSFDIARIEYPAFPAFSYDLEYLYQRCLPSLFPNVIWTREAVKDLIERTWSAKIHAEAALMELAVCSPNHQHGGAIGVTKKCCRLCWLYKELLNEHWPDLNFVLPGTHGTFFAWIPPPNTPEVILKSLQAELLRVVRAVITKMELAHSRQSSAAGYESGREEIYEPFVRYEDFEQFSDPFDSSDAEK